MIQKLEISGQHIELTPGLQKYTTRKIGALDKYVSRRNRASLHIQVKLKESKAKDKRAFTCEVILRLPGETIRVSEQAINIIAAVDIVESKLKIQLKKYKDQHSRIHLRQRFSVRFRKQLAQTEDVA